VRTCPPDCALPIAAHRGAEGWAWDACIVVAAVLCQQAPRSLLDGRCGCPCSAERAAVEVYEQLVGVEEPRQMWISRDEKRVDSLSQPPPRKRALIEAKR
jgi:hypothetical protein